MTVQELKSILHEHQYVVEANGIPYKFIQDTLNVNNKPVARYLIEETENGFYFRTDPPISASNPLKLFVDDSKHQKRITLVDEYRNLPFCTLVSV